MSGIANQIDDETRILRLWTESLQSGPVALDDDLVELGGDSLVAMTLISRINAEFGVELELWDLLDAGTPRRMLAAIQRSHGVTPQS